MLFLELDVAHNIFNVDCKHTLLVIFYHSDNIELGAKGEVCAVVEPSAWRKPGEMEVSYITATSVGPWQTWPLCPWQLEYVGLGVVQLRFLRFHSLTSSQHMAVSFTGSQSGTGNIRSDHWIIHLTGDMGKEVTPHFTSVSRREREVRSRFSTWDTGSTRADLSCVLFSCRWWWTFVLEVIQSYFPSGIWEWRWCQCRPFFRKWLLSWDLSAFCDLKGHACTSVSVCVCAGFFCYFASIYWADWTECQATPLIVLTILFVVTKRVK